MRLDLAKLFSTHQSNAGDPVLSSALQQLVQLGKFLDLGGDNDLAADLKGHAMIPAEFDHCSCPVHAGTSFEGAGFVIDSRVNDAAVVPRLMTCQSGFLFGQHEPQV